MIYVECLLATGRTLDESKRIALASTTWIGDAKIFQTQITNAVMNAQIGDFRPLAQEIIRHSIYFLTLAETGKRDNLFRRCAFMWFGLII